MKQSAGSIRSVVERGLQGSRPQQRSNASSQGVTVVWLIAFGKTKASKGGVEHTRVQRIKFQVPVSFAAER
jgi:hypothetical protein